MSAGRLCHLAKVSSMNGGGVRSSGAVLSAGSDPDRRFGRRRWRQRRGLLRTLALVLILIGCIAKTVSPVRAAMLAGDLVAAGLVEAGAETAGHPHDARSASTGASASAPSEATPDTGKENPPTACLYAVHCVPLVVAFGLTPRPAIIRIVHVSSESAVPAGWQSHPPLRPPRIVA